MVAGLPVYYGTRSREAERERDSRDDRLEFPHGRFLSDSFEPV
jgi:hypothetical protein